MTQLLIRDESPNTINTRIAATQAVKRMSQEETDKPKKSGDAVQTPKTHFYISRVIAESTSDNFQQIKQNSDKSHETVVQSMLNTEVSINYDEESKINVVEVSDKATSKLLRTIPSDAMRNVLENIDEHIDEILNEKMEENRGILLDTSK